MGTLEQKKFATWILYLIGVVSGGNAAWMLVEPNSWFVQVPAGMEDFGPYNVHLVRDVGAAYMMAAVAILIAARRLDLRFACSGLAAAFFGLHATTHLFETMTGRVDDHHWFLDLPTTYLPFMILTWVALSSRRSQRCDRDTRF